MQLLFRSVHVRQPAVWTPSGQMKTAWQILITTNVFPADSAWSVSYTHLCRLSKDDGTENESASIATQKSILTDYVKKQGWHLAKTYVDDGYSGTNFQRPSFQNMIKDIENGRINCVITKDLSRLGRNYLDCGLYLEVFFPEHNVRYIAVNDGVDTLNKSAMDITPFRNILNEMYSADVSVKIKSAYRCV